MGEFIACLAPVYAEFIKVNIFGVFHMERFRRAVVAELCIVGLFGNIFAPMVDKVQIVEVYPFYRIPRIALNKTAPVGTAADIGEFKVAQMLFFGIQRAFDGALDKERAFALHDYIVEFYIVDVHSGISTILADHANTRAGFPYHQIAQHRFADNARPHAHPDSVAAGFEALFLYLSELRHPFPVVIYLKTSFLEIFFLLVFKEATQGGGTKTRFGI